MFNAIKHLVRTMTQIKSNNPNGYPLCKAHGKPAAGHINGVAVCADCWKERKHEKKPHSSRG